jgi:hypothetical protein
MPRPSIKSLADVRAGKPAFYPDQSIYAEYACAAHGLSFDEIDGGTGLVFTVSSATRIVPFGAGRSSFFPQNTATAATLATDKYLAKVILERAGVATLGGQYFFLHERHRAHRAPGHEQSDALAFLRSLGGAAFIKPLTGSRGDYAQAVATEAALVEYLHEVSHYYDAVLMQPIFAGKEYRIFLLDGEVLYSTQKTSPVLVGDGLRTIGQLLGDNAVMLRSRGISSIGSAISKDLFGKVLPHGMRWTIPGRMNRSAGGSMHFAEPDQTEAAFAMARNAAAALGLRAAAIDLFTDIGGDPDDMRLIEVNANPSIRFLEESGRDDLILMIWRHTFAAIGLLDV